MRRSPVCLLLTVLLLSAAACSSSGSDTATTTAPKRGTTIAASTVTNTSAPPLTGSTQPMPIEAQKRAIALAPVLSVDTCSPAGGGTTPGYSSDSDRTETTVADTTVPETTVPAPGESLPTPSADGSLCYRLGPVAADGNDLTKAEAADQEGDWTIAVRAADGSVDKLNTLFDACYQGRPSCPATSGGAEFVHGSVAIIVDGAVVSAPSVNGPNLADDVFTITGSFTEAEATRLARLLNA